MHSEFRRETPRAGRNRSFWRSRGEWKHTRNRDAQHRDPRRFFDLTDPAGQGLKGREESRVMRRAMPGIG
jgi:hypothetical protein